MKKTVMILSLLLSVAANAATQPAQRTESSIEPAASSQNLLGDWQVTPTVGGVVVRSTAGLNVGATMSYRLLNEAPLYIEPRFDMSFLSDVAMFNFGAGARYDIELSGTRFKPFGKFSVGPSFQTKGDILVLNAFAGFGILFPVTSYTAFRAEAGLINYNGSAGAIATAGIGF